MLKNLYVLFSLLQRVLNRAYAATLRRQCTCGADVTFHPSSRIDNLAGNSSLIQIGANTHVLGQLLVFPNGGKLSIGEYCYVGEGSRIWAMSEVTVGNRVLISHNVNIHDNGAHSISATLRHQHIVEIYNRGHPTQLPDVATKPVCIEDDAWIGFNATILKGVKIGRGAIVGACAVVTKDVPEFAIVAGNPATVVGQSKP